MRKKIKRIHVNRHHIAANKKSAEESMQPLPVFTAKEYNRNVRGNRLEIVHDGEVVATFVYQPEKPLSCGAVAWIETREEVRVVEP